jgi:signal transduction histidine kinase
MEADVKLQPLFDQVISTARGLLNGKPVRLHTDVAADLPAVYADEQRLTQIFLNVIGNACKFTDEGDIRLTARVEKGELLVSISDTGPGVAPEDMALVFEPFKQTDGGIRKGGGTGLGMPITKNLVEAHGGRIWLESELNRGSIFHIVLPLHLETAPVILA